MHRDGSILLPFFCFFSFCSEINGSKFLHIIKSREKMESAWTAMHTGPENASKKTWEFTK